MPASSVPRRASSVPRRRAWDNSLSDLSIYRATPPDIERRKAKTRSNNANQARAELDERQQRMMVGDFSQVLEALEPTKLSDRSRPLDYESPRTTERPKHNDANMRIEKVHAQLDDLVQPGLEPCTPSGAEICTSEGAAPLPPPDLAGRASGEPVVDLDREIELFKLRAGARLQGVAPPRAATRSSATTPSAKLQPEASPAAADATEAARCFTESMAPTPSPSPHPASPHRAADTSASLAPDALGLARMMQKCGWLESEMGEYEASRDVPNQCDDKGDGTAAETVLRATAPSVSASVVVAGAHTPAAPAAPTTKPRKAKGATPTPSRSTGTAGRASFGACNERLVDMVGRLLGHLKRAQTELGEQARLRQLADAQLAECRQMLHTHKASSETEAAALRGLLTELRASHEALLNETRARLTSLEQSRASAYSRSLIGSMQLPPPAEATETSTAAADLSTAEGALMRDSEGRDASPFGLSLPSMALPTAELRSSPAQVTRAKAVPALFSPMLTTPRDFALSPESEPEPTPPPLYARSAACGAPAARAAAGGASPRVAWGQWGVHSAEETKEAVTQQRPLTEQRQTSTTASSPPLASAPSLDSHTTGRRMGASSNLMGAPLRVCKPSASQFAAPLARPPASYAADYAASEGGRGPDTGLAIADAILAAATASEAQSCLEHQRQPEKPEGNALAAAGRTCGRNCACEQRSSAGVLQAYYDEIERQQSSRTQRARA